ncbi:hypothetical protein ATCC90586_006141 [Pythium insidiosum]|nr:hypothetical protein ATCC90586_006141 [Pythium insidiosum]
MASIHDVLHDIYKLSGFLDAHCIAPRLRSTQGIVSRRGMQLNCLRDEPFRACTEGREDVWFEHRLQALLSAAAGGGRLAVCRWLVDYDFSCASAMAVAAMNGHAHVVRFLLEEPRGQSRRPLTAEEIAYVRDQGYDDVLEALGLPLVHSRPPETPPKPSPAPAPPVSDARADAPPSSKAALSVLTDQMLMHRIGSFQKDSIRDRMEALEATFTAPSTDDCDADVEHLVGLWPALAIMIEDMELLQDLYDASHRLDLPQLSFANAMYDAAADGQLDMLQWLHDRGDVPCRPDAMAAAARAGFTEVVRWLLENRPETAICMDASVLVDVARASDLDMLQLCHDHALGVFTVEILSMASNFGFRELRIWYLANRTEGLTQEALEYAPLESVLAMWPSRRHLRAVRGAFSTIFSRACGEVSVTNRAQTFNRMLAMNLDLPILSDGYILLAKHVDNIPLLERIHDVVGPAIDELLAPAIKAAASVQFDEMVQYFLGRAAVSREHVLSALSALVCERDWIGARCLVAQERVLRREDYFEPALGAASLGDDHIFALLLPKLQGSSSGVYRLILAASTNEAISMSTRSALRESADWSLS